MSSETKWTPGPWSRGTAGDGQDGYVYCNNALGSAVAICYGSALRYTAFPREEEIANAQLIASAPKLYEALAALVESYEQVGPVMTREERHAGRLALIAARTALASARGES